jgi:hypothetical protein
MGGRFCIACLVLRAVLTETSRRCKVIGAKQEKYCVANERWVGGLPEVSRPLRQCLSRVLDSVVAVAADGHHLAMPAPRERGTEGR